MMVYLFFSAQAVAIFIIVFFLLKILNQNLKDLAIRQLETGVIVNEGGDDAAPRPDYSTIKVITHRPVQEIERERILKAVTKLTAGKTKPQFEVDKTLKGGMVLVLGPRVIDCSLANRLRRAF